MFERLSRLWRQQHIVDDVNHAVAGEDVRLFDGSSVIDVPSLFAVVVYPLAGWGIVKLLQILFADNGGIRRIKTIRRTKVG